ncbi:glycosyltransferase [Babesia caballi]|uniref:Glycosyltransferase n=1 Tax=Babesia caballi TaxID=5871 RepID=A0AAV4M2S3_BABCB|nr:glycosyltransferase [Babesia caballi]
MCWMRKLKGRSTKIVMRGKKVVNDSSKGQWTTGSGGRGKRRLMWQEDFKLEATTEGGVQCIGFDELNDEEVGDEDEEEGAYALERATATAIEGAIALVTATARTTTAITLGITFVTS